MSMVRVFVLAAMIAIAAPTAALAQIPPGGSTQFKDDGPTPPAPPPPPAASAAPAAKEPTRTDKPVGDYTKFYQKKDFTTNDRRDMTYYWRQPEKLESGATYPLVIILHDEHGGALAGQYIISPDIQAGANASFIAIPMIANKKIWAFPSEFPEDPATETRNKSLPQSLPDVKEFIDYIRKEFPVDDRRIYIVGCGDGGWGALGAVYNYPSEFAAAVSINGDWGQKQTGKLAKSKTPIFMENGADDKVTSAYLASVTAMYIQTFKGKISYVNIPGGTHDCNEEHYYMKGVWKWMYAQHRQ